MEKMKLNARETITKEKAVELLKNNADYLMEDFYAIHQKECKDHKYELAKIAKKGSIFHGFGDGPEKADNGIFAVIVTWDYIHGRNFSLNNQGLEKKFKFIA